MAKTPKRMRQPATEAWARAHGISMAAIPPAVEGYHEGCPFTARQIATRAVILQGVVAVASEVNAEPVVEWYREQGVWEQVSLQEQRFLLAPESLSRDTWNALR